MAGPGRRATSVFFGGGTPSLIPAEGLARILRAIAREDGAEVTVECNPDSVEPEQLAAYAAAGVNRISLGVQSMQPHVLAELGRTHDPAGVERAVRWARRRVRAPQPRSHLRDAVRVARRLAAHPRRRPRARARPRQRLRAHGRAGHSARTRRRGRWTERTRRRRPGREVRDRRRHPARRRVRVVRDLELGAARRRVPPQPPLLGPGRLPRDRCAAHGHADGRRWWNVRTPERYIAAVRSGASAEAGDEHLDVRPGSRRP